MQWKDTSARHLRQPDWESQKAVMIMSHNKCASINTDSDGSELWKILIVELFCGTLFVELCGYAERILPCQRNDVIGFYCWWVDLLFQCVFFAVDEHCRDVDDGLNKKVFATWKQSYEYFSACLCVFTRNYFKTMEIYEVWSKSFDTNFVLQAKDRTVMSAQQSKPVTFMSHYAEGLCSGYIWSCAKRVSMITCFSTMVILASTANQRENEHQFCIKLGKFKKETFEMILQAHFKKPWIVRNVLSGNSASRMAEHCWKMIFQSFNCLFSMIMNPVRNETKACSTYRDYNTTHDTVILDNLDICFWPF